MEQLGSAPETPQKAARGLTGVPQGSACRQMGGEGCKGHWFGTLTRQGTL